MSSTQNINVFLVEDNFLYQCALKKHLEENIQNANIHTFKNGEDMLLHIKMQPDVIVLDYMLSTSNHQEKNGMSILKKVLFKKPYIPVIMLSEQKNKALINELIDEGAYDYVAKFKNDFERITKHISDISIQINERRQEEKSILKLTMRTYLIVGFIIILFYEINKYT
jgi:DNA-binding NarL/FixJ family response regulator